MKHLLIIFSILLLSSFLTSCEKKDEILYRWKTSSGLEWKTIGDKNNNAQYKGEVKREYIIFGDGLPEGLGSLTVPDGEKYVGEWKDGLPNGQGTFTYPDGKKYVGEWKDGKKHGQGTYTWSDGSKYKGEYKDGKRNGQGTLTYADGREYDGEWKEDKRHGVGILSILDGKKVDQSYVGDWKDGKPWNLTIHDKKGNIKMKWVNGKKQ